MSDRPELAGAFVCTVCRVTGARVNVADSTRDALKGCSGGVANRTKRGICLVGDAIVCPARCLADRLRCRAKSRPLTVTVSAIVKLSLLPVVPGSTVPASAKTLVNEQARA